MQRVIKFRAWDKGTKAMISNIVLTEIDNDLWYNKDMIIMQFTGLLDVEGVEIYHLDLIKTPAGIGEVVWDKCYWIKWSGKGRTTIHNANPEQMQVIGNSIQSPELMEEASNGE